MEDSPLGSCISICALWFCIARGTEAVERELHFVPKLSVEPP